MDNIAPRNLARSLLVVAPLLFAGGCAYSVAYMPDYVKPEAVAPAERVEGKALVYMERTDVEYVYKGSPGTFTGGGTTLTVPIGIITREVTKGIWAAHFTGGADFATSLDNAASYRAVVRPRVTSFAYAYHQLENLGFAITPGVTLSLEENLIAPTGVSLWSRTYSPAEVKAGSYMMSFKPEEKVNRLAHEIIADQTRQAVRDAKAFIASMPQPSPGPAPAAAPAAGCNEGSPVDLALCRGQVAIGMKREQVLAVLGQPTARSSDGYTLRYGDRYLKFGQDDVLQAITNAE